MLFRSVQIKVTGSRVLSDVLLQMHLLASGLSLLDFPHQSTSPLNVCRHSIPHRRRLYTHTHRNTDIYRKCLFCVCVSMCGSLVCTCVCVCVGGQDDRTSRQGALSVLVLSETKEEFKSKSN